LKTFPTHRPSKFSSRPVFFSPGEFLPDEMKVVSEATRTRPTGPLRPRHRPGPPAMRREKTSPILCHLQQTLWTPPPHLAMRRKWPDTTVL
jgi:hypothetical protein